jgi:hypothetical protein
LDWALDIFDAYVSLLEVFKNGGVIYSIKNGVCVKVQLQRLLLLSMLSWISGCG